MDMIEKMKTRSKSLKGKLKKSFVNEFLQKKM